ncbi:MAG: nuclear transport factor 2 family protein [Saprospiraceae bacterium]|jgi:ketosteroid isomerase-like protein|nr:nuclear transport factor 2 family protein [Saprospiraceae bacterium]
MHSVKEFIDKFYQAIIDKEVAEIINSYHVGDDTYVILEGPRLSTKGYENIAPGWRDFCNSAIVLKSIEWLEGPFTFEQSDSATLAGVIRLIGNIGKDKTFDNTFRASFLLLKDQESYKIIHEHVSGALADPYGIGDWKNQNKD